MTAATRQLLLMLAVIAAYALLIVLMMFLLVAATRAEPIPPCNPALDPYLCGHAIPHPGKEYIITKDIGGVINYYLMRYSTLKDTHIIVDGLCNSACTLVLLNEDVCVTDKAWFGFHTASTEAGTALLMSIYPQKVKDWIAAHGGLSPKVVFAHGYELAPRCK